MITPPGLPPGCPPWFARPAARAWTCAPAPTAGIRAFHTLLPGYAPTPLTQVPAIAAAAMSPLAAWVRARSADPGAGERGRTGRGPGVRKGRVGPDGPGRLQGA